jgi:nicotinamidase-related amidase
VKDALLLVDVINDFRHEGGDKLLDSFRERYAALVRAVDDARSSDLPIVYANDSFGIWDGDVRRLVAGALDGDAGQLVAGISPRPGDSFVVKPRYSAFDHTPLVLILRELEIERILIAGAATEMCVVQTAIDAREEGLKVSILADACATTDPEIERLALQYAESIVGARVQHAED